MAISRGALNPKRTVPPRTSTTWISMSSPMRIVSPTLRVSVSTGYPSVGVVGAVHGVARTAAGGGERACPGSLSAERPPDRMPAVGEDDLAGPGGEGVHHDRRAQV